MNRPWIWNLLFLALLAGMAIRLPSSLNLPRVTLPDTPEIKREPRPYPEPSPPPDPALYGEIVSRNLFSPQRGKVEPVPPTEAAPPKPSSPPKATLFGVVIEDGGEAFAYLTEADKQAEKPKRYRQGDSFSGAEIKEIRPDRVILAVGSSEHTVILRTPKEGVPVPRPSVPKVAPKPSRSGQKRVERPRPTLRQRRAQPRNPFRPRRPPARSRVTPEERALEEPGGSFEEDLEFLEEEYEDIFNGQGDEYYEEADEPW